MKSPTSASKELASILVSFRSVFLQIGGFSFVTNLLMLVPAIYMMSVYDRVLSSRNEYTLLFMTILVVGAFILMGVLEWVRSRMLVRVGVRLDQQLRERVFQAGFKRNLQRAGGSPAEAIQDLTSLRQFVAGEGVLSFFDTPWIPLFMLVITLIHPLLGLFSVFSAIVLFILALLNEIYSRAALHEASSQAMAANMFANNNLRSAEVIHAMGMLGGIRQRWAERYDKFLGLQVLASDRASVIQAVTKGVRIASQSLILGLSAWLAIRGSISPGAMIGAMILMGRTLAPVEQLIGVWRNWVASRDSYERLTKLLDQYPESQDTMPLPSPKGEITMESVTVAAPGNDRAILKALSFRIPAGDVVGVIGPSGAGKSTLARLLVGIWYPNVGHVRLDGADTRTLSREEVGPHIGYLPQEIDLFDGTVAENICRFGPVDSARIVAAANSAGVHELILRLPQGYDTPIGVDGNFLSGGEKQRIALARALYGEPELLVLDEPNSNLDEVGEAALLKAIAQLKGQGKTVVLISHRGGLLPVIDKLLVLRDGALLAYGPRDQVLAHLQGQTAAPIADRSKEG